MVVTRREIYASQLTNIIIQVYIVGVSIGGSKTKLTFSHPVAEELITAVLHSTHMTGCALCVCLTYIWLLFS